MDFRSKGHHSKSHSYISYIFTQSLTPSSCLSSLLHNVCICLWYFRVSCLYLSPMYHFSHALLDLSVISPVSLLLFVFLSFLCLLSITAMFSVFFLLLCLLYLCWLEIKGAGHNPIRILSSFNPFFRNITRYETKYSIGQFTYFKCPYSTDV